MPRSTKTRKPRKSISQLVPTVWFVDLANLLIFYFLATTTLTKVKGFESEIPAGQQAEAQGQQPAPTVKIVSGTVYFNTDTVDVEDLAARLDGLGLADKEGEAKVVMFETSGSVSYQDYYAVMSAIARAGGVAVLITEEKGGDGK
jgi:biopolymer transport protein ExbD